MALAAGLPLTPLALGGDSVTGNNAGIAAISIVSIVCGYALLFALWWFVFRPRREGDGRVHAPDHVHAPEADEDHAPAEAPQSQPGVHDPRHRHGNAVEIQRPVSPRFRRR